MLSDLVQKIVSRAARKTALAGGGVLFIMVGIAFLTMALWMHLAFVYGAIAASVTIGVAYLGVGLIMLGMAGSNHSKQETPSSATPETPNHSGVPENSPPLMQAFLYGMEAGINARKT